jgi:deoxycytidylate deaminase
MNNIDSISSYELDTELVIGLVCSVGTETSLVIDLLRERLGRAGYRVELIKVSSDVIPQLVNVEDPGTDQFKRYSDLMTAGNKCRELEPADDSILAYGIATCIALLRRQHQKDCTDDVEQSETPVPKTAYIIDSLKRPEEVAKLRVIYSSGFLLLGIHSDLQRRERHLVNNKGMTKEQAQKLIERDQAESTELHGQRVNDTFHLADFFVRISDSHDRLRCDIQRLVELWFGNPFLTPSFDEYAMFMAFASALRSADLSRQVGAVITRDSEILSTGANECPKAGGGLYWAERNSISGCLEDDSNGRDFKRGRDSNRTEQLAIIERIITEAERESPGFDGATLRRVLKKSGIRDLTEFGRVVHAEMEALMSCARRGVSTVDGTVYCTTFPCHNCAKHIVAAGIARVVFVEPYSKSKALEFHDDSIIYADSEANQGDRRVRFEPFVGVGPRRFFELFSMNLGSSYKLDRKISDTGEKKEWHIENAQLRLQMRPTNYLRLEMKACQTFGQKLNLNTINENPNDQDGNSGTNKAS